MTEAPMNQATFTFRLDGSERDAFIKLCASNGVTPSLALRELVRSAISKNALPISRTPWFEVPATKAAIAEIEAGGGKSFDSVEALMRDLQSKD